MTIWLLPNTRALALGMILPTVFAVVGIALLAGLNHLAARVAGSVLISASAALGLLIAWQLCLPRLAYQDRHLLLYLQGSRPIRVPLEIVECFLLGQAPTMLPGKQHEHAETASIVIRLSETAADWARRDVKPALGKWCDGYITIRGTWCEPLDVKVVYRLNALLAESKGSLKNAKVAS